MIINTETLLQLAAEKIGIKVLKFDDDWCCNLEIDQGLFYLSFDTDHRQESMVISAMLGPLTEISPNDTLKYFMGLNSYQLLAERGIFCLDEATEQLLLVRQVHAATQNKQSFSVIMEQFVDDAYTWSKYLQEQPADDVLATAQAPWVDEKDQRHAIYLL